jgi:hypothetical protein
VPSGVAHCAVSPCLTVARCAVWHGIALFCVDVPDGCTALGCVGVVYCRAVSDAVCAIALRMLCVPLCARREPCAPGHRCTQIADGTPGVPTSPTRSIRIHGTSMPPSTVVMGSKGMYGLLLPPGRGVGRKLTPRHQSQRATIAQAHDDLGEREADDTEVLLLQTELGLHRQEPPMRTPHFAHAKKTKLSGWGNERVGHIL